MQSHSHISPVHSWTQVCCHMGQLIALPCGSAQRTARTNNGNSLCCTIITGCEFSTWRHHSQQPSEKAQQVAAGWL